MTSNRSSSRTFGVAAFGAFLFLFATAATADQRVNPLEVPFAEVAFEGDLGGAIGDIEHRTGLPICLYLPTSNEVSDMEALRAEWERETTFHSEDVTLRECLDYIESVYPSFVYLMKPGPMAIVMPAECVQNPTCKLYQPAPRVTFKDAYALDAVWRFIRLNAHLPRPYNVKFLTGGPSPWFTRYMEARPITMTIEDGVLMDVLNRPFAEVGFIKWSIGGRQMVWHAVLQQRVVTSDLQRAREYAARAGVDEDVLFARYEQALETAPWPVLKDVVRDEYARQLLYRRPDDPAARDEARALLGNALEHAANLPLVAYGDMLTLFALVAETDADRTFARGLAARKTELHLQFDEAKVAALLNEG